MTSIQPIRRPNPFSVFIEALQIVWDNKKKVLATFSLFALISGLGYLLDFCVNTHYRIELFKDWVLCLLASSIASVAWYRFLFRKEKPTLLFYGFRFEFLEMKYFFLYIIHSMVLETYKLILILASLVIAPLLWSKYKVPLVYLFTFDWIPFLSLRNIIEDLARTVTMLPFLLILSSKNAFIWPTLVLEGRIKIFECWKGTRGITLRMLVSLFLVNGSSYILATSILIFAKYVLFYSSTKFPIFNYFWFLCIYISLSFEAAVVSLYYKFKHPPLNEALR